MNSDFDQWREELLQTGNIVQDGDTAVPQEEKEKRFNIYVEMVKAVSGQEGREAFITLVESLQAKDDYGAYQATYGALWRFPPSVAAHGLIASLPRLVERHPDYAGDILAQLANATRDQDLAFLSAFRGALGSAPADAQNAILDFIIREENNGWLDGPRRGVIRFGGSDTTQAVTSAHRPWWRFW
jgi:hypothetical protein